jgi:hypothetical protein
MNDQMKPAVVQYLYVHQPEERFFYPSARSASSRAAVATRYLECALVQAASLALRNADCELILATNVTDPAVLGPAGAELLERMRALGVQMLHAEYRHRPADDDAHYLSSRYVLDAILAATDGQPSERPFFLTDLDCVWVTPEPLLAAVPAPPEVGCIYIEYPPDWDAVGTGTVGNTRHNTGELAREIAATGAFGTNPADVPELPPWVGGELLVGTGGALRELVGTCERLDALSKERGEVLPTEEQVLSLAGALGLIRYRELSALAWRVHTGPRHEATPIAHPESLSLWHLPGEKGLSLRRTARELSRGKDGRLARDLADPRRMARRFNVAGTGVGRRLRDDGWLVRRRIAQTARTRLDAIVGRD